MSGWDWQGTEVAKIRIRLSSWVPVKMASVTPSYWLYLSPFYPGGLRGRILSERELQLLARHYKKHLTR